MEFEPVMPEVVLTCAADERFSLPMAVMLYSAMKNFRGRSGISIYVVDVGISALSKSRIRRALRQFTVDLHWLRPPNVESITNLPTTSHLPLTSYYRLFIPDLLPDIDKAIYLDSDILVEADLAKLWEADTSNCYLLAALARKKILQKSSLALCQELKPYLKYEYFNAGVMVINLVRMREDAICEKAIDFAHKYPDIIRVADQDLLNAVCVGKWIKIHQCWNWLVKSKDKHRYNFRPNSILHFVGDRKPWRPEQARLYQWDDVGITHRRYNQYLVDSGWFSKREQLSHSLQCIYFSSLRYLRGLRKTARASMQRVRRAFAI